MHFNSPLADLFVVHEIPATPLASTGIIAGQSVVTLVGVIAAVGID
jgi:hypothetical protein